MSKNGPKIDFQREGEPTEEIEEGDAAWGETCLIMHDETIVHDGPWLIHESITSCFEALENVQSGDIGQIPLYEVSIILIPNPDGSVEAGLYIYADEYDGNDDHVLNTHNCDIATLKENTVVSVESWLSWAEELNPDIGKEEWFITAKRACRAFVRANSKRLNR